VVEIGIVSGYPELAQDRWVFTVNVGLLVELPFAQSCLFAARFINQPKDVCAERDFAGIV
jgi:hypothetical protein